MMIRSLFFVFFAVMLLSQIYAAGKYIPNGEKEFLFPKHPVFSYLQTHAGLNRFISVGEGHITSNFPLMYRLYSPDGVDAMYSNRYAQMQRYMQTRGRSISDVARIETAIAPSSKQLLTNKDPYPLRFMQIDGIKYIVKLKHESNEKIVAKTIDRELFSLVWQDDTWQIYRYNQSLPRYFWTNNFTVVADNTAALQTLFDPHHDPHDLVLAEHPFLHPKSGQQGKITLTSYTPNEVRFKTSSTSDGLLYLSDTYSSAFTVLVDSKEGRLLRADYTFRAIPLTKGVHDVLLYYNTDEVVYGFLIGLVIMICIVSGSVLLIRRKTVFW
jgi:hypothetical protein